MIDVEERRGEVRQAMREGEMMVVRGQEWTG